MIYAATAPLPDQIDEILFTGFLRKKGVELVKGITVDVEVPANSDIVIEGYVDPAETFCAARVRSAITRAFTHWRMTTRSFMLPASPTEKTPSTRPPSWAGRRWRTFI